MAIERYPHLIDFIRQGMQVPSHFANSLQKLRTALVPGAKK
jgi:flagellar biosynthesis/type III secretory pathway ATPase